MKAIVHIGTAKTGTTAIQAFLQEHWAEFLNRGVLIPNSLGRGAHRKLAVMAREDPGRDRYFKRIGIQEDSAQREAICHWKENWDRELADTTAQTCLISSEHLHSGLQSHADVANLKAILSERFESVRIVIYIRDQLDLVLSLRSTALKSGRRRFDIAQPSLFANYDYRATLMRWGKVFGQDAIALRLYERSEFLGDDLIADFAQSCGLDVKGLERPSKANPRLDDIGLRLLTAFNKKLSTMELRNEMDLRGKFTRFLESGFTGGPDAGPSDQTIQDFQAFFAESNEWVRSKFFSQRDHLFSIQSYPSSEQSGSFAEEKRLIDALVDMWIATSTDS